MERLNRGRPPFMMSWAVSPVTCCWSTFNKAVTGRLHSRGWSIRSAPGQSKTKLACLGPKVAEFGREARGSSAITRSRPVSRRGGGWKDRTTSSSLPAALNPESGDSLGYDFDADAVAVAVWVGGGCCTTSWSTTISKTKINITTHFAPSESFCLPPVSQPLLASRNKPYGVKFVLSRAFKGESLV